MSDEITDSEAGIDILARTIYGEARGEYGHVEGGVAALIAVGNVVMNRLQAKGWYGKTIHEVCLKPKQFSCWNVGDPNRVLIMRDDISDPVFKVCRQVATKVACGEWPDLTKSSNHYHTASISPAWARKHKPSLRLGRHVFYQLTNRTNRGV